MGTPCTCHMHITCVSYLFSWQLADELHVALGLPLGEGVVHWSEARGVDLQVLLPKLCLGFSYRTDNVMRCQ